MRIALLVILSALAAAPGCRTREAYVVAEPRPVPPPTPVTFYLDPQAPIRLYRALPASRPPAEIPPASEVVGKFRVLDGADRRTARELADEARRRGGNAVVVESWKYGWVGPGRERRGFEMKGRLLRTP